MDENNTNQENGFVLQDAPTSQPEQQQTIQPEVQPEQRTTQDGAQEEPESRFGAQMGSQSGPQPMPSSDNTYRFQNTDAQRPPREPRQKKGMPFTKTILSAVIFGVIAAACFFGVTKLLSFATGGSGNSVGEVTGSQPKIPITTVSGTAAAQVGVSDIVEQVMPSIVAITEKSTQTSYFGQTYSSEGAGSGFIVKQDNDQLLIVTNNHVVANADKISVQFNDGESVEAEVKGTSESHDLAVLTVQLNKMKESTKNSIKVASLGSSNDAKVGEMVIAIGNALGYGQSVTVGYLSAKNREVSASDNSGKSTTQILLQTDAAINPGNSGGALIDTNGNVIGINSSKYFSYGNTSVEGMGYAIPMSDAVSIINDLMDRQVLKDEEKGYLGITGRTIDETVSESYGLPVGVYVAAVSDTGAAYKAGIKQGDVITKINDREVKTINEVQEIVNSTKVGTEITVLLKRSSDGEYKEKEVKVTLKSKDTLDSLDDGTEDNNQGNRFNPNNPQSNGNYNQEDDSEVIPWGSIY